MCFEALPNTPTIDIRIDLNESCNCCCYGWKGKPKPDTPMYINSGGIAVKFDKYKTEDCELARTRSFAHLNAIIEHNASISKGTKEQFDSYLAHELMVDSQTNPEDPPKITLDFIQRVNNVIKDVFDPPLSNSE